MKIKISNSIYFFIFVFIVRGGFPWVSNPVKSDLRNITLQQLYMKSANFQNYLAGGGSARAGGLRVRESHEVGCIWLSVNLINLISNSGCFSLKVPLNVL